MQEWQINLLTSLLTLIGVILTAVISVITVKKEIYSRRVIEERTKWLLKFRTHLGEFMSAFEAKRCSTNNYYGPNFNVDEYNKLIIKGENARYQMISMLNTTTLKGNEYNFYLKEKLFEMNLIKKIEQTEFTNKFDDDYIKDLMKCFNLMLEQVWQESKRESRYGR